MNVSLTPVQNTPSTAIQSTLKETSGLFKSAASQLPTQNEIAWPAVVGDATADVTKAIGILKPLGADNVASGGAVLPRPGSRVPPPDDEDDADRYANDGDVGVSSPSEPAPRRSEPEPQDVSRPDPYTQALRAQNQLAREANEIAAMHAAVELYKITPPGKRDDMLARLQSMVRG